ncbi:MAG: peptidase S8/S53 domain-containing protein [Podila humilis]|nr:MAG: peptidase S8/S53 domain-containing protein [Podila humilis]
MKKLSLSAAALLATLAITLLALYSPYPAFAHCIAATLEHVTVIGTNNLHSSSSNEYFSHMTIIHTASEASHARNRFWVDFHDAFADRALFEKHPALGGCFGKGCKVAYGANFIIDKKGKQPKDDVMDLQGHGTHVAGIVAANDTSFIGVTPHATLGAYRVFSCDFTVGNDVIIKAMIRAVEDGMDVINMSLGAPSNWRQEREARVVDMLTRNSTLIFVIAAGNEGSMGVFDIALPVGDHGRVHGDQYWSSYFFTVGPALKDVDVERTEAVKQIMYSGLQDFDFFHETGTTVPGHLCPGLPA